MVVRAMDVRRRRSTGDVCGGNIDHKYKKFAGGGKNRGSSLKEARTRKVRLKRPYQCEHQSSPIPTIPAPSPHMHCRSTKGSEARGRVCCWRLRSLPYARWPTQGTHSRLWRQYASGGNYRRGWIVVVYFVLVAMSTTGNLRPFDTNEISCAPKRNNRRSKNGSTTVERNMSMTKLTGRYDRSINLEPDVHLHFL